MKRLAILILGLSLALPLMAQAGEENDLVLCRKKTKLKVRKNECKNNEKQILPGELGLVGEQGPPGDPGAPGAPGSARAWASVNPGTTPTLVDALGVDSVRNGSNVVDGVYCLTLSDTGIDPAETAPVASVNLTLTNTSAVSLDVLVLVRPSAFVCQTGELEVLTGRVNHATNPSELDLAGDIGFNIIVP